MKKIKHFDDLGFNENPVLDLVDISIWSCERHHVAKQTLYDVVLLACPICWDNWKENQACNNIICILFFFSDVYLHILMRDNKPWHTFYTYRYNTEILYRTQSHVVTE